MIKKDCSILLVDRDFASATVLAQKISDIPGMSVSACLTDGNSAVEYLWEHPVDILITDIDLPGMDGLELAEYCRKYEVGCAVIIISDIKDFDCAIRALQCGVINYLPKPVQFPQLAEALETARASVHISRLYLRSRAPGRFRELSQAIRSSFYSSGPPDLWKEEISRLLTAPGLLLRISHREPISAQRDDAFDIYANLLKILLPKASIFTLCPERSSSLYLLIPKQGHPHRTVQSLNAWFAHIITHEVTLTTEGTIETADQLVALASRTWNRNKTIDAACEYIQNHLSEPLTREVLAEQVFVSPSYFGRLFKKITGMCFNDYLTELRINHAKTCLAQNISIKEVAAATGFRNVKYFSEMFYKKTGYMPSEYRRALLTGTLKQH